ncbi:glycosyltransferase [Oxalobacter sp. OttesenSCG-928-P03]|nr:glycosyltransferase [Oxalobacter sp. OttesenSCG-928-P03]
MHLLDLSQFYVPECRKIRAYLAAKSKWLSGFAHVRHTILAPSSGQDHDTKKTLRVPGLRIPFFPGFRLPRSPGSVECLIKSLHPDCIEVSDPFQFARITVNLKQENNISIGAVCHFSPARILPWGCRDEARAIHKLAGLYSHFDVVFISSAVLTEKFRESGLKNTRHLPPGVDAAVFHPDAAIPDMRGRLGLKEETRLLAYVEYTPARKNLDILFEAIRKLDSNYHLLVIGSHTKGINTEKISCFYFHQHTHSPDILATLISSCDLLVHPELHQHYPLSMLEAMSCGLPVVGFNSGSFSELIDEKCGICINTVCPQKLADGISCAYEKGIMEMGRAARQKAEKNHDWNDLLAEWRAHYVSILASKGNYPKHGRQRATFPAEQRLH